MTYLEQSSLFLHDEAMQQKPYNLFHYPLYSGPGYLNISAMVYDDPEKEAVVYRQKYYTRIQPLGNITRFKRLTKAEAVPEYVTQGQWDNELSTGVIKLSSYEEYVFTIGGEEVRPSEVSGEELNNIKSAYGRFETYKGFDVYRNIEEVIV